MRPLPSTACQEKPQVRIEVQNGTWHPRSDPKSFPTHRSHSRGTPRFPARLQLSPFTPPDRDKMVDSPALSGRGSRSSWCTSGCHQSNEEIRDVASWMVPRSERPRFPALLLIRTRCPDTSLKATLWMKAQHEGALTPSCILRKKPKVPLTARQMVCYPVNNSRGKWSSIPPHKTRPDSPVPTLQGPCGRSFKWRGTLRFLPQLEMRTFAIAPNPVEFRERLPSPQYA